MQCVHCTFTYYDNNKHSYYNNVITVLLYIIINLCNISILCLSPMYLYSIYYFIYLYLCTFYFTDFWMFWNLYHLLCFFIYIQFFILHTGITIITRYYKFVSPEMFRCKSAKYWTVADKNNSKSISYLKK